MENYKIFIFLSIFLFLLPFQVSAIKYCLTELRGWIHCENEPSVSDDCIYFFPIRLKFDFEMPKTENPEDLEIEYSVLIARDEGIFEKIVEKSPNVTLCAQLYEEIKKEYPKIVGRLLLKPVYSDVAAIEPMAPHECSVWIEQFSISSVILNSTEIEKKRVGSDKDCWYIRTWSPKFRLQPGWYQVFLKARVGNFLMKKVSTLFVHHLFPWERTFSGPYSFRCENKSYQIYRKKGVMLRNGSIKIEFGFGEVEDAVEFIIPNTQPATSFYFNTSRVEIVCEREEGGQLVREKCESPSFSPRSIFLTYGSKFDLIFEPCEEFEEMRERNKQCIVRVYFWGCDKERSVTSKIVIPPYGLIDKIEKGGLEIRKIDVGTDKTTFEVTEKRRVFGIIPTKIPTSLVIKETGKVSRIDPWWTFLVKVISF